MEISDNGSTTQPPAANSTVDDVIAAGVVLIIGIFGLTANIMAIVCSLLIKSAAKQQFTAIFISLAIGDTFVLLGFVLYVAPSIYTQSLLDLNPILSGIVVAVMVSSFFGSRYSALMMAVNRFVAVWAPQRYATMYQPRNLRRQIGACWAAAIVLGCFYGIPGCGLYFNPFMYIWLYPQTTCGSVMEYAFDFVPNALIFTIAAILSFSTFFKLRRKRAKVAPAIAFAVAPLTPAEKDRRMRENAFLAQSCVHCSVYILVLFLFHVVPTVVTGKWAWFFLTTVSWVTIHFVNGFVYLFLMPNIRKALFDFFVRKRLPARDRRHVKM